ncbi:MAG: SOUL family heme-binding protein [Rhodoglobus sp.]
MTQKQQYTVISDHDGYEVRWYPAHIVAQVDADGTFFEAGNRGFRPLIRYISAANIAMTAPVIQSPGAADRFTVSFVMPTGVTSVPAPLDPSVRTVSVPEQRVAARRFSGGSHEDKYAENADALTSALKRDGFTTVGDVFFARYDPPWKPGFLKHNEALIVVG